MQQLRARLLLLQPLPLPMPPLPLLRRQGVSHRRRAIGRRKMRNPPNQSLQQHVTKYRCDAGAQRRSVAPFHRFFGVAGALWCFCAFAIAAAAAEAAAAAAFCSASLGSGASISFRSRFPRIMRTCRIYIETCRCCRLAGCHLQPKAATGSDLNWQPELKPAHPSSHTNHHYSQRLPVAREVQVLQTASYSARLRQQPRHGSSGRDRRRRRAAAQPVATCHILQYIGTAGPS